MAGIKELHLVGGNAALDFANSVNSHTSDHPRDNLNSYADLLVWSERAGVVTREQARELLKTAAAEPHEAAGALKLGLQLRETIFQLFMAIARGDSKPEPNLDLALIAFNSSVKRFLGRGRVVRRGRAWDLDFDPSSRLDGMLAPIAWSAVELLRGPELDRVKLCGKDTCGWLFVDRSKNHSRRWCEMSDCGNSVKARRHYERTTRRAHATKN